MSNLLQALRPRLRSFGESLYLLSRNKLSLLAVIVLVLLILLQLEMNLRILALLKASLGHWCLIQRLIIQRCLVQCLNSREKERV